MKFFYVPAALALVSLRVVAAVVSGQTIQAEHYVASGSQTAASAADLAPPVAGVSAPRRDLRVLRGTGLPVKVAEAEVAAVDSLSKQAYMLNIRQVIHNKTASRQIIHRNIAHGHSSSLLQPGNASEAGNPNATKVIEQGPISRLLGAILGPSHWSWTDPPSHSRSGTMDGYIDTDSDHPRRTDPEGDPKGDHQGWGSDAAFRPFSPAGEMPEHFSILTILLGECTATTCSPWNKACTFGVALSAVIMAWTFKNLKVISDVYFVPSTLALSKRLNLPNDVAGATLLAFGSSAPEFCTNVVATFFIVNECGVGDIIGSAIHNILLIIGVSGLFAGRVLVLWWYPLTRDSIFYLISILELTVFLWDEQITILEASLMVLTYAVYCAWMIWNQPIYNGLCKVLKVTEQIPDDDGDDDDGEEEGVCWYDPLEMLWRRAMPNPENKTWLCFLSSLFNISWLAYLMVDAATRFGCLVGMPPLFMGLVFLAAGTSIPDAFASLAAARKGEGDMAVSNALGSNIFDILLGLGLPWLIALLLGKPIVFLGASRLIYWVTILLVVLAAFLVVVIGNGWRLNKPMGVMLVSLYMIYVGWGLLKSFDGNPHF